MTKYDFAIPEHHEVRKVGDHWECPECNWVGNFDGITWEIVVDGDENTYHHYRVFGKSITKVKGIV